MLLQLGVLLLFFSSIHAQYPPRCSKMNEVWKQCSSRCEQTCENQNPSCVKSCGIPACQCVERFYRDPRSGECLNKNQCDTIMNDCSSVKCGYGFRCVMYKSWPTCVKNNVNYGPSTILRCNSIECPSPKVCREDSRNGARCDQSDDPPPTTCAVMLCAPMTQCVEGPNGASCVPIPTDPIPPSGPTCSPASPCPPGMACIEGTYGFECKSASVDPPRPTYTCDNLKCKDGEYCTMGEDFPKCVPAPVDPMPPPRPMPPPPGISCNFQSDCPPGLSCTNTGFRRECARVTPIGPVEPIPTCDDIKCSDGEYCVMQGNGPTCLKAPVDPIRPPSPQCSRRCRRRQKCVSDPINGPVCKADDGCGPNEVFKQCSNACFEKNCGEENFSKQCSFVCGAPKCQCAEGYFRETNSRACVRPNQCPSPVEYSTTTTERTTTDNSIPCGDTTCHPAWTCQKISVPCTKYPCPPDSYFCMAPHTIPPPDCGSYYCSTSERCDPVKKVCVLLPGATSPPAPTFPESCGPDGMVCAEGETCQVAMAGCSRLPCPPPIYSCGGGAPPTTTTPKYEGPGPSLPPSCASVKCPYGQSCRMKEVRCYSGPCAPVPTCQ